MSFSSDPSSVYLYIHSLLSSPAAEMSPGGITPREDGEGEGKTCRPFLAGKHPHTRCDALHHKTRNLCPSRPCRFLSGSQGDRDREKSAQKWLNLASSRTFRSKATTAVAAIALGASLCASFFETARSFRRVNRRMRGVRDELNRMCSTGGGGLS